MLAGRWNALYSVAHGARVSFRAPRPIPMHTRVGCAHCRFVVRRRQRRRRARRGSPGFAVSSSPVFACQSLCTLFACRFRCFAVVLCPRSCASLRPVLPPSCPRRSSRRTSPRVPAPLFALLPGSRRASRRRRRHPPPCPRCCPSPASPPCLRCFPRPGCPRPRLRPLPARRPAPRPAPRCGHLPARHPRHPSPVTLLPSVTLVSCVTPTAGKTSAVPVMFVDFFVLDCTDENRVPCLFVLRCTNENRVPSRRQFEPRTSTRLRPVRNFSRFMFLRFDRILTRYLCKAPYPSNFVVCVHSASIPESCFRRNTRLRCFAPSSVLGIDWWDICAHWNVLPHFLAWY